MSVYEIYLDDRVVGKAQFSKEGMYTSIKCTCKIPQKGCYDGFIKMPTTMIPLGMFVPMGDEMGTYKRVLSKKLIGDVICLEVLKRKKVSAGIPIEPSKPFPYISKIKRLKVVNETKSGELRLVIT